MGSQRCASPWWRQRRPATCIATAVLVCLSLRVSASPPHTEEAKTAAIVADIPEHSGVLLLSDENFAVAVAAFHPLLVLFDSPARNGSLDVFKQFGDAAVALRATQRETTPRMRFAVLDVTQSSEIPDAYSVVGLPAFVRFQCTTEGGNSGAVGDANASTADRDGGITTSFAGCSPSEHAQVDHYDGGKTSMEFQRFMLEQPQKEVLILQDRAALQQLVTTHPFVVLVVVDGKDTQPYLDTLTLAQVDAESSSTYCVSMNRSLLLDTERKQIPSLVAYRDFGAARTVYTGLWEKAAVASFLQTNKYSVVATYTSANAGYFYDKQATAHVLLFSDDSASGGGYHAALVAQVQQVAQQYYARATGATLRFVDVPKHETVLRDAMLVKDQYLPTVLVVEDVQQPPERLSLFGQELIAALESTAFVDALTALLAETFPLAFKSVEIVDDEGELTRRGVVERGSASVDAVAAKRILRDVVAASAASALSPWEIFKQQSRVVDVTTAEWILSQQQQQQQENGHTADGHDVVVCFASPRCYACRGFATVFEQVAETFAGASGSGERKGSVFAKVNVDKVDISSLQLEFTRLPSIYVFPRAGEDRTPVAFTQRSFTLSDVLAFVDAHVIAEEER